MSGLHSEGVANWSNGGWSPPMRLPCGSLFEVALGGETRWHDMRMSEKGVGGWRAPRGIWIEPSEDANLTNHAGGKITKGFT